MAATNDDAPATVLRRPSHSRTAPTRAATPSRGAVCAGLRRLPPDFSRARSLTLGSRAAKQRPTAVARGLLRGASTAKGRRQRLVKQALEASFFTAGSAAVRRWRPAGIHKLIPSCGCALRRSCLAASLSRRRARSCHCRHCNCERLAAVVRINCADRKSQRQKQKSRPWLGSAFLESGRRDLNPRRPPWQGGTLPLSYSRDVLSQSSQEDFWVNAFFQVFSWETRSAQSDPRLLLAFPRQPHTQEPPCTAKLGTALRLLCTIEK